MLHGISQIWKTSTEDKKEMSNATMQRAGKISWLLYEALYGNKKKRTFRGD